MALFEPKSLALILRNEWHYLNRVSHLDNFTEPATHKHDKNQWAVDILSKIKKTKKPREYKMTVIIGCEVFKYGKKASIKSSTSYLVTIQDGKTNPETNDEYLACVELVNTAISHTRIMFNTELLETEFKNDLMRFESVVETAKKIMAGIYPLHN